MIPIKEVGSRDVYGYKRKIWLFRCERCGNTTERPRKRGIEMQSCGCHTNKEYVNGVKILEYIRDKGKKTAVVYVCPSCGGHKKKLLQSLKAGMLACKECGYKKMGKTNTKYTDKEKRIAAIHNGMVQRCNNKESIAYKNYGGKGITVCEEWRDKANFIRWSISNGYDDGLSIDRKNNNLGYSPDNCRWTNLFVQSQNTNRLRRNNTSGYRGVSKVPSGRFLSVIHSNGEKHRLGVFDTAKEAAIAYDMFCIDNNTNHPRNVYV